VTDRVNCREPPGATAALRYRGDNAFL